MASCLWTSASCVSVRPASHNAPPASASTMARTNGPSADFISSSYGRPEGLHYDCTTLRKLSEIRHGQLQRERDHPEARRQERVSRALRLLAAVALHVDSSGRSRVDVLDRVEHRLLVAGRIELAAGRLDRRLPDIVGQHRAEPFVVAGADHVNRDLRLLGAFEDLVHA